MQDTVLLDPRTHPKPPDTSQFSTPALTCACAAGANNNTARASPAPIAFDMESPSCVSRETFQDPAWPRNLVPSYETFRRKSQVDLDQPQRNLGALTTIPAFIHLRLPQNRWMRRQASSTCSVATA